MANEFEKFSEIAAARPQIWRVLLSLLLIFAITNAASAGLLVLLRPRGDFFSEPEAVFILTGALSLAWLALWLALRLLHRRSLQSALGAFRAGRGRRFLAGMGVAAALILAPSLLAGLLLSDVTAARSVADWWLPALCAAPLILLQTGAEEALFRGYLTQQFAARFQSLFMRLWAPSLLFALLHFREGSLNEVAPGIIAAGLMGAAFTLITLRSGDIFIAWGMHFINNLAAFLLIAPEGYLSGAALFHWPDEGGAQSLYYWADIAPPALLFLLTLRWFRSHRGG